MISRRSILIGLVAAPAVIRIPGLLMPISVPTFTRFSYQSWPIGELRPEYHFMGSVMGTKPMTAEHFQAERHSMFYRTRDMGSVYIRNMS